jgi:hypothetical protein
LFPQSSLCSMPSPMSIIRPLSLFGKERCAMSSSTQLVSFSCTLSLGVGARADQNLSFAKSSLAELCGRLIS